MSNDNDIEIYRQRYETYRHLDKLRWQMVQIVVAVVSAAALYFKASGNQPSPSFSLLIGISLIVLGFAMRKINVGIRKNGKVLSEFGGKVGDTYIPNVSQKWKASSNLIEIFTYIIGLLFLLRFLLEIT